MFAGFTPFTWFHTIISLVMIVAGFAMMFGMFRSEGSRGWTALFLATGVLTSVTGFGFLPIVKLLPSHYVGIISLVVLAIAILARYVFHLAEPWRWIFVVTAMIAFYLDMFVFVTQLFLKVPPIHALAPNAPDVPEPPFAIAQGVVLLVFVYWTYLAVKRYHPAK